MSVETDLIAYLGTKTAITDIIGDPLDNFLPLQASEDAARPFMIYSLLNRERDQSQSGESGLVRTIVQIDCQADDYPTARAMEEALRAVFRKFYHRYFNTADTASTFVQSAEVTDAGDQDSPPSFQDEFGVYHSVVDLEIWYEEPVPTVA